MKRLLSFSIIKFVAISIVIIIVASSCGIQTKLVTNFESNVIAKNQKSFNTGRVWVRSFSHTDIGSVTSLYATGSGGSASGLSVSRQKSDAPSSQIISTISKSGVFESVTPIETDIPHDFILEGAIGAHWKEPWWSWVQMIDLCIHAWFFPTMGRNLVTKTEIKVFDRNFNPIYEASVGYTKKYMCHLWWMITHGGAYDVGSDVEVQQEVLQYAFSNIKDDLKLALNEYLENHSNYAQISGNGQGK